MTLPHIFMGTLREHYILLFSVAGGLALAAGFVGAWVGSWIGARRALREVQDTRVPAADAAQLTAMMHSLDAIALEVERISEAQRFTSRVMAERASPALPSIRSEPKSITPH